MEQECPFNMQEILAELTLLFVEDDTEIRIQMVQFLSRRLHRVVEAVHGREGLELFKTVRPDIVLSDILMPEMDGLAMIRAIREQDDEVPILVLTAHNEEQYMLRSIELGIDRYLLKPVNPKMLHEALTRIAGTLWRKRERERANRTMKLLMDMHPSLLMVMTSGQISYLNQAFLKKLGVADLAAFEARGIAMGDLLEDQQGRPLSSQEGEHWSGKLRELARQAPLVYLKPPASQQELPLVVECQTLESPDAQLFAFADVTAMEGQLRQMEKLAFTDILTGLANRAMGQKALQVEIHRGQRYNRPFAVIMLDVDHFKKINDTHGHETGDQVLKQLARVLASQVRRSDTVVRWGGEEFLAILPETGLEEAVVLAEKLRQQVSQTVTEGIPRVTASFGVAQFEVSLSLSQLLSRADAALYLAKAKGRNLVEAARPSSNPALEGTAIG